MLRSLRSHYLLGSLAVFVAMLGLLLWEAQHELQDTLDARFVAEQEALGPLLVAAMGPLIASRDYGTIVELVQGNTQGGHLAHLEVAGKAGGWQE